MARTRALPKQTRPTRTQSRLKTSCRQCRQPTSFPDDAVSCETMTYSPHPTYHFQSLEAWLPLRTSICRVVYHALIYLLECKLPLQSLSVFQNASVTKKVFIAYVPDTMSTNVSTWPNAGRNRTYFSLTCDLSALKSIALVSLSFGSLMPIIKSLSSTSTKQCLQQ